MNLRGNPFLRKNLLLRLTFETQLLWLRYGRSRNTNCRVEAGFGGLTAMSSPLFTAARDYSGSTIAVSRSHSPQVPFSSRKRRPSQRHKEHVNCGTALGAPPSAWGIVTETALHVHTKLTMYCIFCAEWAHFTV